MIAFTVFILLGFALTSILNRFLQLHLNLKHFFYAHFFLSSVFAYCLLHLLSFLHLPFSSSLIRLITAGLIYFGWLCRPRYHYQLKITLQPIIFFGLIILTTYLLSQTQLAHRFLHADGFTIWFMKANLFYQTRQIDLTRLTYPDFTVTSAFYESTTPDFTRIKYPLLQPLTLVYFYFLQGSNDIHFAKYLWLSPLFSILLLLFIESSSRFSKKSFLPLFFPLYYLLCPSTLGHFNLYNFGGADLWLGAALLIGVYFYYKSTKQKSAYPIKYLALILLSFVPLIKVEGVIVLGLLPLFIKQNSKNHLISALFLFGLPLTLWLFYTSTLHLPNTFDHVLNNLLSLSTLHRLYPAGILVFQSLINQNLSGLIFIPWFISIMVNWSKLDFLKKYLNFFLLFGLVFISVSFAAYSVSLTSLADSALSRLLSQWLPLCFYLLILNLSPDYQNKKILRTKIFTSGK